VVQPVVQPEPEPEPIPQPVALAPVASAQPVNAPEPEPYVQAEDEDEGDVSPSLWEEVLLASADNDNGEDCPWYVRAFTDHWAREVYTGQAKYDNQFLPGLPAWVADVERTLTGGHPVTVRAAYALADSEDFVVALDTPSGCRKPRPCLMVEGEAVDLASWARSFLNGGVS